MGLQFLSSARTEHAEQVYLRLSLDTRRGSTIHACDASFSRCPWGTADGGFIHFSTFLKILMKTQDCMELSKELERGAHVGLHQFLASTFGMTKGRVGIVETAVTVKGKETMNGLYERWRSSFGVSCKTNAYPLLHSLDD